MRALDQGVEAFIREAGPGVFRRAQYDLLVPPLDKNIGQFVRQALAARDGEQMLLVFGMRTLDQRSDIKCLGLGKNRRRHLDGVVAGEQAQYLWRGERYGREPERKQSARGLLDRCNQAHEDVVDQVDFLFGILVRAHQKKVGEVPQHDGASLVRAVRDRAIELLNEFEGSAHGPWETVLVGHGLAVRNWLTSIQSVCDLDSAIRDANRKVRTVGILLAVCDARRLFAAAPHGSGESSLAEE